jgi:four helix bundle protein
LIYAQASCDEANNQTATIIELYPDISEFVEIQNELDVLGKMINSFIKYVESDWRT